MNFVRGWYNFQTYMYQTKCLVRYIIFKYIPLFYDIVINLQSSSIYFKDIKDTFNH